MQGKIRFFAVFCHFFYILLCLLSAFGKMRCNFSGFFSIPTRFGTPKAKRQAFFSLLGSAPYFLGLVRIYIKFNSNDAGVIDLAGKADESSSASEYISYHAVG